MQYGLPVITALLTAKFVGGLMNHSFYEIIMQFKMFPYLAWEPPHHFLSVYTFDQSNLGAISHSDLVTCQLRAIDVMNSNVICLSTVQSVRRLVEVLRSNNHNAFPVNDADEPRRFRGTLNNRTEKGHP